MGMRCKFAFSQTTDGRLLVTLETVWGFAFSENGRFTAIAFDDENVFIQRVVLADFSHQDTIDLIAGVLLAIAGAGVANSWISVTMSELQLMALGLVDIRAASNGSPSEETDGSLGFTNPEDLRRLFLEAPIAVCVLTGPEHTVSFINPPYTHLTGRDSDESFLGKPIRKALKELAGQPFFPLLDEVYRTGVPYQGKEVHARMHHEGTNSFEDHYYDFIYHPVRDRTGEVCGILCQASDVTERVLERHVREAREAQLYRQWAELEAMYRDSPLAMCLVDAKDLRILRMNEIKARMIGLPADQLVGRIIPEVFVSTPQVTEGYLDCIQTKQVQNREVFKGFPEEPEKVRRWLWNLKPVLGVSGDVETIASTILDITNWASSISTPLEAAFAES